MQLPNDFVFFFSLNLSAGFLFFNWLRLHNRNLLLSLDPSGARKATQKRPRRSGGVISILKGQMRSGRFRGGRWRAPVFVVASAPGGMLSNQLERSTWDGSVTDRTKNGRKRGVLSPGVCLLR